MNESPVQPARIEAKPAGKIERAKAKVKEITVKGKEWFKDKWGKVTSKPREVLNDINISVPTKKEDLYLVDSSQKVNLPGGWLISSRDRHLIKTHRAMADEYSKSGSKLASWEKTQSDEDRAYGISETIYNSGILPKEKSDKPHVLVSLSSNSGIIEREIATKFGPSFKVFSGDFAEVKRVQSDATPLRFDASFLPFSQQSVDVIVDFKGAIWHEAALDFATKNPNADNLLDIFSRLRLKLKDGGLIIIDDNEVYTDKTVVTGAKIDKVLNLANEKINGFEVMTIGEGETRLRVFKKINTDKQDK